MSEASKLLPAERLAAIRRRIFPWLPQLFEYKPRRAGYRASNQDMLALVDIRDLLVHAEAQAERIEALEWKVGEEERDFRRRAAEAGDIDEEWEEQG